MARKLEVEIVGDPRSLERSFGKAKTEANGFGRSMTSAGKVAGAALAGGMLVAGAAIKGFVDKAQEAEVSQRRMKAGLASIGVDYKAHAAHIDEVIQKQSKLAALDDEDLQDSFTRFARTTRDVNKALELNALAADVARGRGISLEAATGIVTKAQLGNVGALRRMGIEMFKVTDAQDALRRSGKKATEAQKQAAKDADDAATRQSAIAALQKSFAGSAKEYGQSSAAAGERFKVAWENLQESLGNVLLPTVSRLAGALTDVIGKVETGTSFLREHAGVATALAATVGGLAAAIGGIAIATKAWAAAQAVLNLAMEVNPLVAVATAAIALGAGLVIAYRRSQEFRDIVNGSFGEVRQVALEVVGTLEQLWQRFGGTITAVVKTAFGTAFTVIRNTLETIKSVVEVFLALLHGDWGRAWEGVKSIVSNTIDSVLAILRGTLATMLNVGRALGQAFVSGISAGLSALAEAVVRLVKMPINALIAGWNALKIPSAKLLDFPGVRVLGHTIVPAFKVTTPEIDFPDIPLLAQGGIVTGPTLAMLGERGPEAVLPLGRLGNATERSIVIPITVELDGRVIAEIVRTHLMRTSRGLVDSSVLPSSGRLGLA